MRQRDPNNPRTVGANASKYATANLGDRGDHVFRLPRPQACARLYAWLVPHITGVQGVTEVEELEEIDALAVKLEAHDGAVGWLVGTTWHHATLDLETVEGDDRLEYGEAVLEELDDAGYTSDEVNLLTAAVTRGITLRMMPPDAEVAAQVERFPDAGGVA